MIIINHSLYECYKYMHKYLNSSGGQRWLAQAKTLGPWIGFHNEQGQDSK